MAAGLNLPGIFFEEKTMNKLLATLIAAAFAVVSFQALAQIPNPNADQAPAVKSLTPEQKAARDAARAKAAAMTPEEKAAAKKARQAKAQAAAKDRPADVNQAPAVTGLTPEQKAAKAAAADKAAMMTPEQKAAAKKARQEKAQANYKALQQTPEAAKP
jgi:NADH-quinone oxidoreductase subunit C